MKIEKEIKILKDAESKKDNKKYGKIIIKIKVSRNDDRSLTAYIYWTI